MITGKKIVLILGNGFDMDLGRRTSYKNFIEDRRFWPFGRTKQGLGAWLNIQAKTEKWYDLEMLLRTYASLNTNDGIIFNESMDKKQFQLLRQRMADFLKDIENKEFKHSTMATNLLWWLNSLWHITKVYSFNYTDVQKVLKEIGIENEVICEYVHGNLLSKTQILGVDDSAQVRNGYEFLYKTFQSSYHSHSLLEDLRTSDCVIFYGLCFGSIDYPYFRIFFQERCSEELYSIEQKKKYIYFFTKDENSETEIKKNLMKMNDNRLMQFYAFNEVAFFYEDEDWQRSPKVDNYFNLKLNYYLNLV